MDIYISNNRLKDDGLAVWSDEKQLFDVYIKPEYRKLFYIDRNQLGVTFRAKAEGR